MLYTHWWYFRCFCMVSQLRQMIRPNCSRFPGIDLLPNRATSAFSTSSELLLDVQVGFNAHVGPLDVVFLEEATSFWIVPVFWEQSKKVGFLFFGARFFTSEVVKPTHVSKTGGRWTPDISHGIFRGTSVRNMDVEPSEALVIHPEWKEHPRDHLKQVDPSFLFLWGDSPVHWRSFFGTNCPWVFPSFFDWKSLWC